jgi:hypothetical protein
MGLVFREVGTVQRSEFMVCVCYFHSSTAPFSTLFAKRVWAEGEAHAEEMARAFFSAKRIQSISVSQALTRKPRDRQMLADFLAERTGRHWQDAPGSDDA